MDSIKYFVQAKRYKPNTPIPIESVRALRGVLPDGYKGIFITTGNFTSKAYEFASNDASRPLILMDGKQLINTCIEKGIGFRSKPIFHREDLINLMKSEKSIVKESFKGSRLGEEKIDKFVKKLITSNDIRARILRIPRNIIEKIPIDKTSFNVKIGDKAEKILNINKTRAYFAGVTDIYKDYGLLDDDGNRTPRDSYWFFNTNDGIIEIKIEKNP